MGTFGPPVPDPIGTLGRVNSSPNIDEQPADHNHFQGRLDALIEWAAEVDADPSLAFFHQRFAGMTAPPMALQSWPQSPGIVDILTIGDSTDEGDVGAYGTGQLGAGNWNERLARSLPYTFAGAGFIPIWRRYASNVLLTEPDGGWIDGRVLYDVHASAGSKVLTSATGAFIAAEIGDTLQLWDPLANKILDSTIQFVDSTTQVRTVATASGNTTAGRAYVGSDSPWIQGTNTDVWNCSPFALGQRNGGVSAATQKTFELPPGMTCVAYRPVWIDAAGTGNWQHRADTGAWVNMAQTRVGDNDLHAFTVVTPATRTISFRAFNGAGAVPCYLAGVIIYAINPLTATRGVIVHDCGKDSFTLASFVRPTATNPRPMSIIAGSPGSINPDAVTMIFSNDAAADPGDLSGLPAWITNLGSFITKVGAVTPHAADLLLLNEFEQNPATRDPAIQAAYRAALRTVAATRARAVLDLYDAYAAYGFTGWSAANTLNGTVTQPNGLMNDDLHESAFGHETVAALVRRALLGG